MKHLNCVAAETSEFIGMDFGHGMHCNNLLFAESGILCIVCLEAVWANFDTIAVHFLADNIWKFSSVAGLRLADCPAMSFVFVC